jgi:hypothetical protein
MIFKFSGSKGLTQHNFQKEKFFLNVMSLAATSIEYLADVCFADI